MEAFSFSVSVSPVLWRTTLPNSNVESARLLRYVFLVHHAKTNKQTDTVLLTH